MAVIYEQQKTDISWYSQPLEGTAKDNFERILELRKAFCHPLTINKDGTLNDKYFSNESKETAMYWTDIEMLQLLEGIYEFGVDSVEKWIKIQAQFLPQRDFIEVRLKLSQMLGTQDLAKYKHTKFTSEKQISGEFAKNKAEAIEEHSWDAASNVALKPNVAKLTKAGVKNLEREELENWKRVIYDNPSYIYRTASIKQERPSDDKEVEKAVKSSKPAKGSKSAKKKAAKEQSNTLDQYNLIKQPLQSEKKVQLVSAHEKVEVQPVQEEVEPEVEQQVAEEPKAVEKPKKQSKGKNAGKKAKKGNKKKKKGVPALPESSDDEEMLCVE